MAAPLRRIFKYVSQMTVGESENDEEYVKCSVVNALHIAMGGHF